MKKNTIGITIGIAIAVGVVSFFGGMKYADYQRTQGRANGTRQFQGMMGTGTGQTQGRNGLGGRPITGEVINKDESSITIKMQDGGSRIIMLTPSTTYSKTAEGTIQDIAVGSKVGVFGTENTDKSMTAQNIQLNPQFRMGSGSALPTPAKK